MHLADLTSYAEAQSRLAALYRDPHAWTRKVHRERGRLGAVLFGSNDFGVRPGDLGREALPRSLRRLPKLRRT